MAVGIKLVLVVVLKVALVVALKLVLVAAFLVPLWRVIKALSNINLRIDYCSLMQATILGPFIALDGSMPLDSPLCRRCLVHPAV